MVLQYVELCNLHFRGAGNISQEHCKVNCEAGSRSKLQEWSNTSWDNIQQTSINYSYKWHCFAHTQSCKSPKPNFPILWAEMAATSSAKIFSSRRFWPSSSKQRFEVTEIKSRDNVFNSGPTPDLGRANKSSVGRGKCVSPTKEVAFWKGLKKLATDPHDLARPSLANYVSEMLGCNNTSNGSNSGFNSH